MASRKGVAPITTSPTLTKKGVPTVGWPRLMRSAISVLVAAGTGVAPALSCAIVAWAAAGALHASFGCQERKCFDLRRSGFLAFAWKEVYLPR